MSENPQRFDIHKFVDASMEKAQQKAKKRQKAPRSGVQMENEKSRDPVSTRIVDDFLRWHWGSK